MEAETVSDSKGRSERRLPSNDLGALARVFTGLHSRRTATIHQGLSEVASRTVSVLSSKWPTQTGWAENLYCNSVKSTWFWVHRRTTLKRHRNGTKAVKPDKAKFA